MDDGIAASRYWCHMCSQIVNPIMEVEIKCPFCQSGFVEEMENGSNNSNQGQIPDSDFGSDRALSLWAPILLGMMSNPRPHGRRFRIADYEEDDNDDENHDDSEGIIESIMSRRRRRSSAAILQLLQGIRAGLQSESENNDSNDRDRDRERDSGRDRERERERVILINPFNQTIIVQGSYDGQNQNQNHTPIGSLGDYFIGPGLDLLLQHLAENDPNRYGTPPAQKEAVEALPSVNIGETLQCSVCLDDFAIGTEAKEMPCKHKFHSQCILPWLELHSSCPVCRYQLPADESKLESERSRNNSSSNQRENEHSSSEEGDLALAPAPAPASASHGGGSEERVAEERNESGRRFSFPWPFNGLFSSSSSQSGGNNSTSSPSSQSGNASQANDN
ncbi:E3 ubiquitin-protein ligase RING1 [Melia azedarach]|uniref:E3 ubiquitin-protein ligase RING1 n=1 Tax=Melia azedarach TaxID=155640 RepID=A0ACC1YKL1_MELAZ|nr:E3 ubiquitin-protein ligase RING1 [Melia azedarach]